MDTSELGKVVAELMDKIEREEDDDAELGTIAIVVETRGKREDGSGYTIIQVQCNDPRYWITKGLLSSAIEVTEETWNENAGGQSG